MLPLTRFRSLGNFAFGLKVTGRATFYLPDSTRTAGGVGYPRNLTLDQPPGSEVTFVVGDGRRKIAPLILQGTYKGEDEEEARLWGAELEELVPLTVQLVRSASITRDLHLGGSVEWPDATKPHIRPFKLTFLPKGPAWLDSSGRPSPF